jgi:hypothetical protein
MEVPGYMAAQSFKLVTNSTTTMMMMYLKEGREQTVDTVIYKNCCKSFKILTKFKNLKIIITN